MAALSLAGLCQQGFAAGTVAVNALPTGGKVVAGSANIAQSGNTMNINQSSQRAVINWNSFDVGSQATVNFNQPNAQAATLNYVNSATKSMINGAVNANGQVIFVNNNGVVFGKGAEVNVGGMVATTMNTSADEFMAGGNSQSYQNNNSAGKVINKGSITGNNINSYIALMAPQVKNTGVITATLSGNNAVALVAGQKVNLTFSNNQLVSVSVDVSVVNALIANKLLINAGSGQVIIAANSAQDLMGSVIKNTGSISANGISTAGGKISLTADTIDQAGTVQANSEQAAAGNISLKGNNITLASNSKTTATGAIAGGNINVGVNNTSTQTVQNAIDNSNLANTVSVQKNATVDTSATQKGNGGTINIWSKLSTMIAGALSSKGGVQSGNGGFIETSSKGNVTIAGSAIIDSSAPKGKTGQWTVDPMALIIDSTAASVISNALNTTNVTLDATGSNSNSCIFGACTNSQSPLIRIMAGADIYSGSTATSLNLIATGGQIDINSNITAGQVYAVAQAINVNGSINTNGGSNSNIYLAGAMINILGNINSNGSSNNSSNSNNTNTNSLNSVNSITAANRRNGQSGLNADTSIYTGNAGLINILATGDIAIDTNSYISANGQTGGAITIVSTAGKITINGIVDSIGKGVNSSGNGGNIAIVGKTQTDIIAALISSEGLSQGGVINLGQINNLGNGTILAPPATAPPALSNFVNTVVAAAVDSNNSITSSNINIDSQTGINAPNGSIVVFGDLISVNNSNLSAVNGTIAIGREGYSSGALAGLTAVSNSTLIADRVETSGDRLGTQAITVHANEWLLDPSTVAINATGPTTGGNLAAALATSSTTATTILTSDIQNAINGGTSVTIIASGAITQSSALVFAVTPTSSTPTLTLNNSSGSKQSITLIAITDNTTATGSRVNLVAISAGGAILSNGVLNVKGSITLDNTYAVGGSASGFITSANANTYATSSAEGDQLAAAATGGTGVTLNGAASGAMNAVISGFAITATTGNVVLNGASSGTWYGVNLNALATASAGAITITGTATGVGAHGVYFNTAGALSATGNITISGTSTQHTGVWLAGTATPLSILAGGSLSITGTSSATTGTVYGINVPAGILLRATGNITLNGTGLTAVNIAAAANQTSTAGAVSITGTSTTGSAVVDTATITGNSITITGTASGNPTTNVSLGAMTINAGGTNLIVTSNEGAAGIATGITQTGNITDNGGSGTISFTSNNKIAQSGAISLPGNTAGTAITIQYDTTSGISTTTITTPGVFTQTTAGTVNYNIFSASTITISNALTSTNGPLNVALQSVDQTSSSAGVANNVTINSTITTRGGYLVIDATGGTINGLGTTTPTITRGADLSTNGSGGGILFSAGTIIKTTATGVVASAATTGGNFVAATSGAFQLNTTAAIDIGGSVNLSIEGGVAAVTGGSYGFLITIATGNNYLHSTGSIYIDARTPWGLNTDVWLQGGSLTSYAGGITILAKEATSVGGYGPFYIQAPISAYGPIIISSDAVGNSLAQPTLNSSAAGTITSTTGLVQITSTSSITGIYSATLAGLISGPQVSISATNSAAGGLGLSMTGGSSGVTISADPTGAIVYPTAGNALSVTSSVGTTGQTGGINITGGAITNQSNGGSVSFVTNGDLTETSAVNFSTANTSSGAQTITYDTRTGNATSQITTGSFTYNATGATKKVNYVEQSNGSNLTIGNSAASSIELSGYILVDNTNSGALTPSTTPSATNMTTAAGVTAQGALTAGDYISLSGINNSATVNAVALGTTTLTVTNASTATTAISVIGNHNTANVGSPGIASTGAITDNANGGGILFKSNGDISQTGAVTVAANTSGTASSITYDTTTGNLNSSITAGALTLTGGAVASNTAINYLEKASGAPITASAISMPGYILLDNTYGGTAGAGGTPTSGYINQTNAATYATSAAAGVTLNGTLTSGAYAGSNAITVNGVSVSTGVPYGVWIKTSVNLTASAGDINVSGISTTSNGIFAVSTNNFSATGSTGNVNLVGISSSATTGDAIRLASGTLINAGGNITLSGSQTSTAGSGAGVNITGGLGTTAPYTPSQVSSLIAGGQIAINGVASNTTTGNGYGLYTGLNGTVYLKSGGNTTISASVPTSDTNGTGAYLYNLGTNVGGNFTVQGATTASVSNANGGLIPGVAQPGALGSAATGGLTGVYIQNPVSITDGATSITGMYALGNISISGTSTTSFGIETISSPTAKSLNGNITFTGISTSSYGIYNQSDAITANSGNVSLLGTSGTSYAVNSGGGSTISAKSVTVTGIETGTAGTNIVTLASPITIVAGGGDINVTGTGAAPGGLTGISATGTITDNAVASNITFTSNNAISQSGAISVVANTATNTPATISYNTTSGNLLSSITVGSLSLGAGTNNSAINYQMIAAGAPLVVSNAINVPGYIKFDNTYGCTSAPCTPTSGFITTSPNIWSLATHSAVAVAISANLTAANGIYIRGAEGTTASTTTAPSYAAVTITGATLTTTGSFTAGTDAINIVGVMTPINTSITAYAIGISGATSINNNSTSGNTNIIAYNGRYNDVVSVTNASSAGALSLSAIGTSADIITVAGTLFTQNSNAGVFIATSNNGNITPPKIVNNGTGPVVIAAGAYLPVGTVNTACSATDCGQITAISGNTITSTTGNVFLYAGSPGTTAVSTTTATTLAYLNSALGTLSFNNTLFGQAYASGNIAATSLPIATLAGINTSNVTATGFSSWTTTAANGPVIQFRIQPTIIANVSGHLTKLYGTNDPLSTAGNIATATSLDGQINTMFVANSTVNPGYEVNGVGGCASAAGCMKVTVNTMTFTLPLTDFINSIYANPTTPRASYGTVAGEQVNGTSSTAYTSSYAYNLLSNHGVLVSSGISVNLGAASGAVGLVITPAPLTITAAAESKSYGSTLTPAGTEFTTSNLKSGVTVDGVTLTDVISTVGLASTGFTSTATAGTYPITPSSAVFSSGAASNYTITYSPGTLTVLGISVYITAANDSKVYGSSTTTGAITYNSSGVVTNPAATSYSVTGLLAGNSISALTLTSTGGIATTGVGSYSIVPSTATISGAGAGNYSIYYTSGTMTITPKPITITANAVTTTYGTASSLSQTAYTVTGGLATGDAITAAAIKYGTSTSVAGTVNAGTYAATIVPSAATGTGGFNTSNYTITYGAGNLTVNQLALTITASAQSGATYGTAYSLGTSGYNQSIATLPNSDVISGVLLQASGVNLVPGTTNAGSYTITPSAATFSSGIAANYNITYATGALTIGKASLTITPNAVNTTYNGITLNNTTYSDAITNYSVAGYKNTDTSANTPVALTGAMTFTSAGQSTVTNAATYAYAVGTLAGTSTNTNYNIIWANAPNNAYVINKALATVVATKPYDGSATFAASTLTISGVGSETLTASAGTGLANSANVVGVSSLLTSGFTLGNGTGLAANYVLPTSTSSVTITPLTLTATINGTTTKAYDTTSTAALTAGAGTAGSGVVLSGNTATSGSYTMTGFVAGEGAYITNTAALYNSANATLNTLATAHATTVSTTLTSSNISVLSNTVLSNYVWPTTASGTATITQLAVSIVADAASKFQGFTDPTFTSTTTGLIGGQTLSSSVARSNASTQTAGIYTGVLVPTYTASAISGNYSISTTNANFTIVGAGTLVISGGAATKVYGTLSSSSNLSAASTPVASYCQSGVTSCVGHIVDLTLTAPTGSSNTWLATEVASSPSVYSFTLGVTANAGNYSSGQYLNVGSYTTTPSNVATVSGATNYVGSPVYIPGTLSVSPLTVTPVNNQTPSKVYDATTALTMTPLTTAGMALTGDVLSMSGTAAYNSKNAGTNVGYTISNLALGSADAANYVLSTSTLAGTNGTITPAPLTIAGLSANSKVYDTTNTATIASSGQTLVGVLSADTVTISSTGSYNGTFTQVNAANGLAVTPNTSTVGSLTVMTGVTLAGADSGNYYVAGPSTALTANITPVAVSLTGTRVYNGTAIFSASNLTIAGIAGQTLTLVSGGSATANSANVGIATTLSSTSGLTLANGTSGTTGLATNYTLVGATSAISITPAAITVSAANVTKTYDGTSTATSTPALVSGTLYANSSNSNITDTLTGGTYAYSNVNVGNGNKTVTVSGVLASDGNSGANYTITYLNNTTSTITAKSISVTALAQTKSYGTSDPTLGYSVSGLAATDSLLVMSGNLLRQGTTAPNVASSVTYEQVGTYPIAIGSLSAGSNYTISSFTSANLTITKYATNALTVTAAAQTKVYGTNDPTLTYATTGLPASLTADGLTWTDTAATAVSGSLIRAGYTAPNNSDLTALASSQNVGTYAITNTYGVSPVVSANYNISYIGANLTITAAPLTVSAANKTKSYATNDPTLTLSTPVGLINATVDGVVIADTSSVLTGSLVRAQSGTLAGEQVSTSPYAITQGSVAAAGGNYALTFTPGTLTITPYTGTIAVTAADNQKGYGSSDPALTYTVSGLANVTLTNGVVINDTLNPTSLFSGNVTRLAGENMSTYAIRVGSLALNGGAGANYSWTPSNSATFTAGTFTINPATLYVIVADSGKFVFQNDPIPLATMVYSGFVNGDTSTTAAGLVAPTLTRVSAGNNAAGTYAITASGASATNYNIVYQYTQGVTGTAPTGTNSNFYIAGSNDLLISPAPVSAVYGTANANINLGKPTVQTCLSPCATTADIVTLTYSASSGGVLSYIDPVKGSGGVSFALTTNYDSTAPALRNVDAYTLTPSSITQIANNAASNNYQNTYGLGSSLSITPAPISITSANVIKTYDGSTLATSAMGASAVNVATSTSSTGIYSDVISGGSFAYVSPNACSGSCSVSIASVAMSGTSVVNALPNYTITYVNNTTSTITPAALTITANAQTKMYGTNDPTLTYSLSGLASSDTMASVMSGTLVRAQAATLAGEQVNTGSGYAILQGSLLANANYTTTFVPSALTITPRAIWTGPGAWPGPGTAPVALTVTADTQTKAYGSNDPTLSYTVAGLVSVTLSNGVVINDTAASVFTGGLLRAGTSSPGVATGIASEQVGTYAIANSSTTAPLALNATAQSNYGLTASGFGFTPATLTITPKIAGINVVADNKTKMYATNDPALTFAASMATGSSLVNGLVDGIQITDTFSNIFTGSITRALVATLPGEQVGSYAITQGTLASPNYTGINYTAGVLSITPRRAWNPTTDGPWTGPGAAPQDLTVVANNQTKSYATNDPSLTYTVTGLASVTLANGVVIADTPATVLTGALTRGLYGTLAGEQVNATTGYAITQGSLTQNTNYTSLTFTGAALTITPYATPLVVTAEAKTKTYGTSDPSLTFTATGLVNGVSVDGVTLVDTVSTALTGNLIRVGTTAPNVATSVTSEQVGAYAINQGTVYASNYNISYTPANLSITPYATPLAVVADAKTKVYGTSDPSLTYSISALPNILSADGLIWTDTVANSITGSLVRAGTSAPNVATSVASEQVGSYVINQGTLDASNYNLVYTPANLTITPAVVTVTANSATKSYGTADPTLTYSASGILSAVVVDGVTINDTSAIMSGSLGRAGYGTVSGEQVGTYATTIGGVNAGSNYSTLLVPSTLTISPYVGAITIAANNQSMVYGSSNLPSLTYTVGGIPSSFSVDGVTWSDSATSVITGALVTTATAFNGTTGSASNVGTYPISQGTLALTAGVGANYATPTFTAGTLAVTPAPLTIAVADNGKFVFQTDAQVQASATQISPVAYSGFVNGDALGALKTGSTLTPPSVVRAAGALAGTYDITASGSSASNYSISYAYTQSGNTASTFTIAGPYDLLIKAAPSSIVYGTANASFTYATPTASYCTTCNGNSSVVTLSGSNSGNAWTFTDGLPIPGGVSFTMASAYDSSIAAQRNVGAYIALPTNIVPVTTTGAVNYNNIYTVAGTLTVTPKPISITTADVTKSYDGLTTTAGGSAIATGGTALAYTDGFSGGVFTYITPSAAAGTKVVTSNLVGITQGSTDIASNYTVTYVNNTTSTITPAALTITANNQSKMYGTNDPTLTYTVSGLAATDSATAVVTGGVLTRANTSLLAGEQVGSYAITQGTLATNSNYTVSFVDGTLSITPRGPWVGPGLWPGPGSAPQGLAVTAVANTKAYGSNDPGLAYTVAGLVNVTLDNGVVINDTAAIVFGSTNVLRAGTSSAGVALSLANEQVGSYTINAGTLALQNANYGSSFTYNSAQFTITPKVVTGASIVAANKTKMYGTNDPALSFTASAPTGTFVVATVDGIAINDSATNVLTGQLTRAQVNTLAGEQVISAGYAITQGSVASSGNYSGFTYTPAVLTITPRQAWNTAVDGPWTGPGSAPIALTVTAIPTTKQFGASDPAFTYTVTGLASVTLANGVVIADTPANTLSGALARITGENSGGVYNMTQGGLLQNANYASMVFVPATLTIGPAPQTINNMAILQEQVTQEFVADYPSDRIKKGDLIFVRDQDYPSEYLQAIEVPSSGAFKFPVPEQTIQELINLSGENISVAGVPSKFDGYKLLLLPKGGKLSVVMINGQPLPSAIQYNPGSQAFAVPKLSAVNLPLSVKVRLMRGTKLLSEKVLTITK